MTRCPSELELERHLLASDADDAAAHVACCPRCQERLARMRAEGEVFAREVFPGTVGAVVGRAARPARPRWTLLLAVPLAAAAAVAGVVLVRPVLRPRPDAGYLGVKGGGALALTVFTRQDGGAAPVADGAAVDGRAALRFQVRPAAPCHLWLLSVDGAGQVSRLFPPAGEAPPVGAGPLPGGAVLDGRGGPERLFAACTPAPLPWGEVEQAARRAAGGGPAAVRAARELPGLPAGAQQATVLLEKRAAPAPAGGP